MLYQEIQSLRLHWAMFQGALQRWRKEDEGVTTLEMVIIGGFLIAAAGLLVAAFNTIWNKDKGNIATSGTTPAP
ncbi:hypothetical protein [Catenulispora subtropica]|uniref:Flp family type IVb pilin n=1 Tax=Catenulispora subtropica TaxID=450798 RepID=A0ABN2RUQ0_9ACTN